MSTTDPTGARAAVMARLVGAAAREPLPGIATRSTRAQVLTIRTHNGHHLRIPRAATQLFAEPVDLHVLIDGKPTSDPAAVAAILAGDHPHAQRLTDDITSSVIGLTAARNAATPHPAPQDLWYTAHSHHPDPSVYFEQLVIDGHPVHPLCRTRNGIDPARYAPERHPNVALAMTPADPARTTGDWPWHDPHQRPLLPVHPLQLARHRPPNPTLHTLDAAPLMSLRTLAPKNLPHLHVKTALDIQLTSARRRVSAAATHNGPVMSQTIADTTGLHIQRETGTCTQVANGEASPHLAAIVRQSPAAVVPDGQIAVPLAALAATDPHTQRPLVATVIATTTLDPHAWWKLCVQAIIPPLLQLADDGIGLEAHGQNTLLTVDNGIPTALVYRDFGGIRVHSTALTRYGLSGLAGDVETDDATTIHTKLIAAAYSVTLAQLVNALSHAYRTPAAEWWRDIAATSTAADPRLRAALFAPTWPIKATTAMRLCDNPTSDQWTATANPIAGLG